MGAISAAPEGATIKLRPGLYEIKTENALQSCLRLDKRLTLRGLGSTEDVIIEVVDGIVPCIEVSAVGVVLQHLSVRYKFSFESSRYAVSITSGSLLIEDCEILSEGGACVSSAGSKSELFARRSRFRGGRFGSGIFVKDQSKATLEDCAMLEGAVAGISLRHEATLVARRCKLYQSKQYGFVAQDDSHSELEDCEFYENAWSAVVLRDRSRVTLRDCLIRDQNEFGLKVERGNTLGLLERCTFARVKWAVQTKEGADPILRNCRIEHSESGFSARADGKGRLEGCVFSHNESALSLFDGGDPSLNNCRIERSVLTGVMSQNAKGQFERCAFDENTAQAILLGEGAATVFRSCLIRGSAIGVTVLEGDGYFERCGIRCSAGAVVIIEGAPRFYQCSLGGSGVGVLSQGGGHFEECEISDNAVGVRLQKTSSLSLFSCRILRNTRAAIHAESGASGMIEGCDLRENPGLVWEVEPGTQLQRARNREENSKVD